MSSLDILMMSLTNLWRRKLRTVLTILGVLIGTTSVVVMLSLANGMKAETQNFIESMGDMTIIEVYGNNDRKVGDDNKVKKSYKLDKEGVAAIKKMNGVQAVMPRISLNYPITVKSGRLIADFVNVMAIDPDVFDDFGFKLADGRKLEHGDKNFAIYGADVHMNFINPKSKRWESKEVDLKKEKLKMVVGEDPYMHINNSQGENIKPYEVRLSYAGTLESSARYNYTILMTIDNIEAIKEAYMKANNIKIDKNKKTEYNQILVKCTDFDTVKQVNQTLKDMGFETYAMIEFLEDINSQTRTIQLVLGGIGAVSLIVAAIGITNTMIMSIYERTKEIGVMKVIGASLKDINRLFLLEAGLIGFFGGLVGLMLSLGVSNIINSFAMGDYDGAMKISIIPVDLMIEAIVFSTLIGLLSGYLPARRAMNLSALEAIRTE